MTTAVDLVGTAPTHPDRLANQRGAKIVVIPKGKQPKDSETLNVPESTAPRQSPHQKLIKMMEPSSQSTTLTPAVSSVVQLAKMPAQDLMLARLNDMERQITSASRENLALHRLTADEDQIRDYDRADHNIR